MTDNGSAPDNAGSDIPTDETRQGAPDCAPVGSSPAGPRPKSRRTALVIGAIAAALVLIAAVSAVLVMNHRADVAAAERQAAAERKAEADRLAAEQAREEAAAREAAELAEARGIYNSCRSQLGPLMNALTTADARLDVGLSQADLSDLIGKASVAYNRIDIDELGTGRCLRVGGALETAFNQYAATVSTWNDCIYELYCDVDDDILSGMQSKWLRASNQLDRAESMLDSLDPDSADYRAGEQKNV